MIKSSSLPPPKQHRLRVINTYGACACGGCRRLGTRLGLLILYKDVSLVNCARRAHTCSIRIIIIVMSLSVCYFHPLQKKHQRYTIGKLPDSLPFRETESKPCGYRLESCTSSNPIVIPSDYIVGSQNQKNQ